jgi:PAS domain S-box-containing protein
MSRYDHGIDVEDLRLRAEELLAQEPRARALSDTLDVPRLVHELNVYHLELEAQNAELRASQSKLEEMRDRYHDLYDLAPVGYFRLDRSGTIEESNLKASRLLGVERAKLAGRKLQAFLGREGADVLHRHLRDVFASHTQQGCDLTLETPTATAAVHIDSLAVGDESGGKSGCHLVMVDLSKLHAAEEELRHAQKMEAVGALASSVAHDFNNVLQAILGCINIAQDDGCPAERRRRFMDRAAHAAQRGGDLAKQLMAFTRKRRVEPRPLRIDSLVTAAAPLLQQLVTKQIKVVVDAQAPRARILADPVQVEQILMNLASNARDAMAEGGTLSVRTGMVASDSPPPPQGAPGAEPARFVRLVVEDSGTGMDAATREHIFEPFFTTKERGKGTGLGLSTVFAVTQRLGGKLRVDSERNKGTAFEFCFPCVDEAAALPSVRPSGPSRLTGTALVVEDDELVRLSTCHFLEEMGLAVLQSGDAHRALELCETHSGTVDVLVTDVMLPVMRGPELVALLRERYPDLPVLFVTANPDFLQPGEIESERTAVLSKPFGRDDLAHELVTLLGA